MENTKIIFGGYITIFLILISIGCKKEIENTQKNPFEGLKPFIPTNLVDKPDSSSLVGIHQYTLKRTCALSGCHDGTFEPDFRTIQSTYSTLVYQPIIKNNPEATFKYRVKPYDPNKSWLVEKITTNDPIISRMPVNLPPLSNSEISAIKKWVDDGAKDFTGKNTEIPNNEPKYEGICAFAKYLTYEVRLDDTLRFDKLITNPFVLPRKVNGAEFTDAEIWFLISDEGENLTPTEKLQINEVLISEKVDDFSNSKIVKAQYISEGKKIERFSLTGKSETFYWRVKINPQEYKPNTIYYFRYRVSDGVQPKPTIIPNENSPIQFKTYSSFYVLER